MALGGGAKGATCGATCIDLVEEEVHVALEGGRRLGQAFISCRVPSVKGGTPEIKCRFTMGTRRRIVGMWRRGHMDWDPEELWGEDYEENPQVDLEDFEPYEEDHAQH
ncbi:hypothetical protein AMTR_s00028p00229280 [Amborella trichopoda]|uniref:Uncharacterized protein n=1 Tax=Amborella trichopoda TaxID=13333 RepID=W1PL00_AMBTC|nr:hypothetical protein AMTR_s00028p00229280 [Amborella trichopoda]